MSPQGHIPCGSSRGNFISCLSQPPRSPASLSSWSLPPSSNLCLCPNISFSDFDLLISSFKDPYFKDMEPSWTRQDNFPHLKILNLIPSVKSSGPSKVRTSKVTFSQVLRIHRWTRLGDILLSITASLMLQVCMKERKTPEK